MTVTCKISDDLDAQLEGAARQRGVTKSEMIREALLAYLPVVAKKQKPSVHDRWRRYCGVVESKISDLATNPRYMKDFGK
jgi:metal-responsive CopG/Arc/MetJ family transcriptional regulator